MVRTLSRKENRNGLEGVEVFRGDLLQPDTLPGALEDVDTVYYLVHSLDAGEEQFVERDCQAAGNFVTAAEAVGIRRVIYLSGLGEPGDEGLLSQHLKSRHEVSDILSAGRFATTVLRAAIIIGAGGASFEILRFLVKTQPVLPDIPELATRCQPIAVADVIGYLADCLAEERTAGETFDIGGPEVFSYRDMLEEFARAVGEVNLFLPTPFFSPQLTALFVGALSSQDSNTVLALLKGLGNEVVCLDNRIQKLLPRKLTPYADAVAMAMAERTG